MAIQLIDDQAKLETLELLLEQARRAGAPTVVAVLATMCKEIRLQQPRKRTEAIVAIERHVESVIRSKTALGYSQDRLQGLATEFIGRWPLIKKALEAYEGEN